MASTLESWIRSLPPQAAKGIFAKALRDDDRSRWAAAMHEWRRLGRPATYRPGSARLESAPSPATTSTPSLNRMKTASHPHTSATQADPFKHLRRYEALIESNPARAGSYYVDNSGQILAELGLLRSQQALEQQTKRAAGTSSADEAGDLRAWRHYVKLVNGGKSAEAATYYGKNAEQILRGRAADEDDDDDQREPDTDPDTDPEGVCSHCGGSGECSKCEGTESASGKKKCRCHACDGKGTVPTK
jgi:hypothetical protein